MPAWASLPTGPTPGSTGMFTWASVHPEKFYQYDLVNSYFGNEKTTRCSATYNPNARPVIPPKTDSQFVLRARAAQRRKSFMADNAKANGEAIARASVFAIPGLGTIPRTPTSRFEPGSPAESLGIESDRQRGRWGAWEEPMMKRFPADRAPGYRCRLRPLRDPSANRRLSAGPPGAACPGVLPGPGGLQATVTRCQAFFPRHFPPIRGGHSRRSQ